MGWTKTVFQKLKNKFPHTVGSIQRWKDDNLMSKVDPYIEKVEHYSQKNNMKRDLPIAFKTAAEPKKPVIFKPSTDNLKKKFAEKKSLEPLNSSDQTNKVSKSRSR